METRFKVRLNQHDAHYGGNLVDGARLLALFGDAATELLIRYDGDEGLFRAYSMVEFLEPVYAGDFVEIVARIIRTGKSSREMEFEAWKIISTSPEINDSAATLLESPLLVCKAKGTCVTPVNKQRVPHGA